MYSEYEPLQLPPEKYGIWLYRKVGYCNIINFGFFFSSEFQIFSNLIFVLAAQSTA